MNTNFEKLNAWECSGTMLTSSVQVNFSQRITSGTIYNHPGLNKKEFHCQAASHANTVSTIHEQQMELQKKSIYPERKNSVQVQTGFPNFI